MLITQTLSQTDLLSAMAYAGLGLCLIWLVGQVIALSRASFGMKRRASLLARAVSLDSDDCQRLAEEAALPKLYAEPLRRLISTTAPERLAELEHRVRLRLSRSASILVRSAPGLGVAGTMSGAWVFLSEFDAAAASGQPNMSGLTDATATTWIGLMIMVGAILVKARADRFMDKLFERASAHLTTAAPRQPSQSLSNTPSCHVPTFSI